MIAGEPRHVAYIQRDLDNGLRTVACTLQETRAASVRVYVDGGSRAEPDGQAGVAHFLEHAVFKGTERWPTSRELGFATERVGGAADAFTDKDHSGFIVHGPADHLRLFLDVLADLMRRPLLLAAEIERERGVIAEELRACRDDSEDLAKTAMERAFWPKHPLGREIIGTSSAIRSISREDLDVHRQRSFVPGGVVVAVSSPWATETALDAVAVAFSAWEGCPPVAGPSAPAPPEGPVIQVHTRRAEQVRFRLGFPCPHRRVPGRHALEVLMTSLAGPATSRLELRLREELALVYDVSASLEQYEDTGVVSIAAGVGTDRLIQALRAIVAELKDVRRGLPPGELDRVRDYLIGRWLCAEGTDFHASFAGRDLQVFGAPTSVDSEIANLRAVQAEDVERLAVEMFRPERAVLTVVGPYRGTPGLTRVLEDL